MKQELTAAQEEYCNLLETTDLRQCFHSHVILKNNSASDYNFHSNEEVLACCAIGLIRSLNEYRHIYDRIIWSQNGLSVLVRNNDFLKMPFAEIAKELRSFPNTYFYEHDKPPSG